MRISSFSPMPLPPVPNKDLPSADMAGRSVQEADDVAKEFETMFVDMMIKSMRQTAQPEDETNAEGIYKGMLDGEYAKLSTDAQSFGIRDMVKQWILDNKTAS